MRIRRHSFSFVLLALVAVSHAAKERISILDFGVSATARKAVNQDASQDLTQQVRDAATSMIDPARFEVMTRENILVMLPPGKKDLSECEGQCEVETARNLGSRWHVVGDIKKPGSRLVLSIRLYDVVGGTQLGGARAEGATVDELIASATPKARELLAKIPGLGGASSATFVPQAEAVPAPARASTNQAPDEVGTIVTIESKSGDADISVDGAKVCPSRGTCQQELGKGKHVVLVHGEGRIDSTFVIVVPRGANRYEVSLREKTGWLTLRAKDDQGAAVVAEIWVDGRKEGSTPKNVRIPLRAGEVVLKAQGFADAEVAERPKEEGGKASATVEMERTSTEEDVQVPRNAKGGKRHPDCLAKDAAQSRKQQLMEQLEKVNGQGLAKKGECSSLSGASQQRCFEELNSFRAQIQDLRANFNQIQDDIDKFKALCPETQKEDLQMLELFEKVAQEGCANGTNPDTRRCEDARFNIADINYLLDQRENLANRERSERSREAWVKGGKRGVEPRSGEVSYSKGLAAHLRYLKELPTGSRRDVILYRAAFIYDLMGRSSEAIPLLMELSTKYPSSRQIGPTNLRIGEFYFVEKKYDSALAYYNKVDPNIQGNESILGLSLFHKAEAFHHIARYPQAIDAFFDYVERCDRGQVRGDLRQEAILYMSSCFAMLPDSHNDARKFFAQRGGRAYEDSVIFEIAVKQVDQGARDRAIATLQYFLKSYPNSKSVDSARSLLEKAQAGK